MYYIVKQGVYTQGVYGPYTSIEEARQAFYTAYETAKANTTEDYCGPHYDFDGRHEYKILDRLGDKVGESDLPDEIEILEHEPLRRKTHD